MALVPMTIQGGRLPHHQRVFIESWSRRITGLDPDRVADDPRLRALVAEHEVRLKGARARLANRKRLVDWSPWSSVHPMDFRMDSRWFRVRQFMIDLHRSLSTRRARLRTACRAARPGRCAACRPGASEPAGGQHRRSVGMGRAAPAGSGTAGVPAGVA